jgi:7-carboxy-7-deazaguanine synthase
MLDAVIPVHETFGPTIQGEGFWTGALVDFVRLAGCPVGCPAYSSDSSSWVSCLRFGGGAAAGIKQLPRYKESAGALAATIHTLRSEIRKYKTMEQEATSLWKARGITWDD